jgi:hypothetical protein
VAARRDSSVAFFMSFATAGSKGLLHNGSPAEVDAGNSSTDKRAAASFSGPCGGFRASKCGGRFGDQDWFHKKGTPLVSHEKFAENINNT